MMELSIRAKWVGVVEEFGHGLATEQHPVSIVGRHCQSALLLSIALGKDIIVNFP